MLARVNLFVCLRRWFIAAAKGNDYNLLRKVNPQHTPESIAALCKSLIEFALEDGTVHFIEWTVCRQKKTSSWINRLADDYPEFADAYATARELMASKLVRSSIYGHPTNDKFNGNHAMEWKSVYSNEWKSLLKWKAEISKTPENEKAFSLSDITRMIQTGELTKLLTQPPK